MRQHQPPGWKMKFYDTAVCLLCPEVAYSVSLRETEEEGHVEHRRVTLVPEAERRVEDCSRPFLLRAEIAASIRRKDLLLSCRRAMLVRLSIRWSGPGIWGDFPAALHDGEAAFAVE
jgi:hypothetical protein